MQHQPHKYSIAAKDDERFDYMPYGSMIGKNVKSKAVSVTMLEWGDHLTWTPRRDVNLQYTVLYDSQWANAVEMGQTKFASHGFEIENKFASRLDVAQNALKFANFGRGFVSLLHDVYWDFTMTANGAFVELVRKSPVSRIEQINSLPSARCRRTGDKKYPVEYTRPNGEKIKLKFWQVAFTDDNRGYPYTRPGLMCAAQAVYKTVYQSAIINQRVLDVESASKFSRLILMNGQLDGQAIKQAMEDGEEAVRAGDDDRHGSNYNQPKYDYGNLIIPVAGDNAARIDDVDLLTRIDDSTLKQYQAYKDLIYANAIGVKPSELNPENVTRVGMNSGAEQGRETDQVNSRGMAYLVSWFEHLMTHFAMPAGTTFTMTRPSLDEQMKEEALKQARVETLATMVGAGIITAQEARNMAGDAGDIPAEFNEPDITDGGKISDNTGEVKAKKKNHTHTHGPIVMKETSFDTESDEFNDIFELYADDINALATELLNGEITAEEFETEMRNLLGDYYLTMFLIGSDIATADEIDATDAAELDDEIEQTRSRVATFAAFIVAIAARLAADEFDAAEAQRRLDNRINLWKQKAVGIFQLAKTYNPLNPNMRHELGNTIEHCETCLELDGQVRTAREWRESGFVPRNPPNNNYECGGWRCDCRLVVVRNTDES